MFSPTTDFPMIVDLLEAATLRRYDTLDEVALTQVLRRPGSDSPTVAGAATVRFHLSATELGDPPRVNDLLIDATDHEWLIVEVTACVCMTRWVCVTLG